MEDFASHSEQVVETTQTPVDTSTGTTTAQPPVTTQEAPKGLTVKYNKEDRFVPDDELPAYVQKGLNYDKVAERAKEAETYQQHLDRIAKFYGYGDHNEYMSALEQAEQQRRIQEEADKLGVDESVIREHLEPMKQKLSEYEKEREALKQERLMVQINAEIADLKGRYPDFEQHQDKVFELAVNQGYKLEDAYKLATYEEKIANIARQTEAETIKKIQENGATSPGALGSEGAEHKKGFANMSKAEQRRMIEEVKRGDRRSFD